MTERIVRKVEATRQMHTMAPLRALTRRKAACYLRISTRSDEQENSLENQRAHYEELFATSPDYEFAGCYYDDGVSGTGISHRHGFQQMVNDALAGKFTLILTKSKVGSEGTLLTAFPQSVSSKSTASSAYSRRKISTHSIPRAASFLRS